MTIAKEKLSDLKDQYEKAEKLVEEDSKHDPPTEPFKSHYEARDILIEIRNNVKNMMQDFNQPEQIESLERLKFILAYITVDLGKISVFTEELSTGERYFQEGIAMLADYKLHPSAVCAYLNGLNQMGILWSNRGDVEKAKETLCEAEQIYADFKALDKAPLTIYDIFGTVDEIEADKGRKVLEKINTLTLFYLAQVFGGLGDLHKSAIYCHTTLKKQLQLKEYDSIDWALNSATLSQYFCTNNRYKEARHHLAAARLILDEFEEKMYKPDMTDDEKKAIEETFKHRSADVDRCWIKYALNLMSDSRERLIADEEDVPAIQDMSVKEPLTFEPLINTSPYESVITDRYLLDMDDVRPVFLQLQKWIEKAIAYYKPDSEASEYSKIVQDHATAYKTLVFFESDPSNQAKMHKRRADLLEGLIKLLNITYYLAIVREVYYELGMTYSNMLDIKLDALEETMKSQVPAPQALKKVNDLCTKSIKNFSDFIESYFAPNTQELKKDLSKEELIPIAYAYFQIGRLWYKYVTPDKLLQLEHANNCLKNYQAFVNLCEEHKAVGEEMKAEVGVSKEMISLLPMKVQKLSIELVQAGVELSNLD